MIKTGGGRFDPDEGMCYFLAGHELHLHYAGMVHEHLLIAINELDTAKEWELLDQAIDGGKKVLIDSGVFSLAMDHARAHGLSHDAGLNVPPHEMDGFDALLERYLYVIEKYGDRVWGYIEIDLGGRENKIKTRSMLEAKGLRPIPVFHPFGDGLDYFDYLAERYDRICFGNIVQASPPVRKRLLATMWERKRKYPNLWVHVLGLTPNALMLAYPANSADSSTWLNSVRWQGAREYSLTKSFSHLPRDFQYRLKRLTGEAALYWEAIQMGAYLSHMMERNMQQYEQALAERGMTAYE